LKARTSGTSTDFSILPAERVNYLHRTMMGNKLSFLKDKSASQPEGYFKNVSNRPVLRVSTERIALGNSPSPTRLMLIDAFYVLLNYK